MQFVTLRFLLLGLPLLLLGCYCMPAGKKPAYMLCSGLLLYGWGRWSVLLIPASCLLCDYLAGLWIASCRKRQKKLLATGILCASVLVQTATLYGVRQAATSSDQFLFPAGIALCILQGLGYLTGVCTAAHEAEKNILRLGIYLMWFPLLLAPLFSYETFLKQYQQTALKKPDIVSIDGFRLFIRGFAEKVILADSFLRIFSGLRQLPAAEMSMLTAWMTGIVFSVYLYFELLGCSEMARGLGRCFGYDLPQNFRHPFFLSSITAFMQSWNSTLTDWFQEHFRKNVFPAAEKARYDGSLVIMGVLIGMWYGMKWQFLLWGLCIGLLLAADKLYLAAFIRKHTAFGVCYTGVILHFLWVLFFADNFPQACAYWKAMLGGGNGIIDSNGIYFLVSYIALLLIGLYIATDSFRNITERIAASATGRYIQQLMPLSYGILLLFCFATLLHHHPAGSAWLLF